RLRQRIRLRHHVAPFTSTEALGYLKHCIRNAGGVFDNIFDPAAADMLYRCSEGIPRIINNLAESVLAAAAEANAPLVMPQLVQHIAHEEFGLQPGQPTSARPLTGIDAQKEAHKKAEAEPDAPIQQPETRAVMELPPEPTVKSTPEPAVLPPIEAASDSEDVPGAESLEEASAETPEPDEAIDFEPVPVSSFSHEPVVRPVRQLPTSAGATVPPKDSNPVTTAGKPAENVPGIQPASVVPAPAEAAKPVASDNADDIPELIQDTQPALAALAMDDDLPDLTDLVVRGPAAQPNAASAVRTSENAPKPAVKPRPADEIPTLSGAIRVEKKRAAALPVAAMRPETPASSPVEDAPVAAAEIEADDPKLEATITEIPSWDRDPTLAELKPDLAALEAELAVTIGPAPDDAKAAAKVTPVAKPAASSPAAAKAFDLPEITLEKELQVREIEAQELLRKAAKPDTIEPDVDAPVKRKHGFDLDKIAAELGKARSLEDVDDRLAETLFGEEMAAAAAEIAAMVAANEPESPLADAALELLNDTPVSPQPSAKKPAILEQQPVAVNTVAPPKHSSAGDKVPPAPDAKATLEITLQSSPDPEPAPTPAATPEPIEEQFGTSMTATLKALSAAQVRNMDESANDEDEDGGGEKPARKLFGLFRGGN
ncbi:MAG: hypothetical protein RLN69_15120, partial [Woeseiaceae bacterium]